MHRKFVITWLDIYIYIYIYYIYTIEVGTLLQQCCVLGPKESFCYRIINLMKQT